MLSELSVLWVTLSWVEYLTSPTKYSPKCIEVWYSFVVGRFGYTTGFL